MDKFPERLREVRGAILQDKFAEMIGVSRASLSYYENGSRTPDIETLKRIYEVTGVSVYYLLGLSDVKNDALATAHMDTGLSEDALQKIAENPICAKFINYLVECGSLVSIADRAAILHDDVRVLKSVPSQEWSSYMSMMRDALFRTCEHEMTACLSAMLIEGVQNDELFGISPSMLPTNQVLNLFNKLLNARETAKLLASQNEKFRYVVDTYTKMINRMISSSAEEDENDTQTPQP